jgi:hypothetical protein
MYQRSVKEVVSVNVSEMANSLFNEKDKRLNKNHVCGFQWEIF